MSTAASKPNGPLAQAAAARPLSHNAAYVTGIDGLRAIAVATVVAFHLGMSGIPGGFIGVDVFFVISGFVVATSALNYPYTDFWEFLSGFYARRIRRIMPALLACLAVTFVMMGLFVPPAWLSQINDLTGVAAAFGLSNVILALNADTYFSPRAEFNPFTHTWSLGVEEQFYLLFPALGAIWIWSKRQQRRQLTLPVVLVATGLASLFLAAELTTSAPRLAFYMVFTRWWELGAGVLLAITAKQWNPRLKAMAGAGRSGIALTGLILLLWSLMAADPSRFPYPWALPPVIATCLLIAAVTAWPQGALSAVLSTKPATYIGSRSYSIYLWHWPVFVILRWTWGFEDLNQRMAGLVITLVAAELSYRIVERPFRRSTGTGTRGALKIVLAGIASAVAVAALGSAIFFFKPHVLLSATRDRATWFPSEPLSGGHCAARRERITGPAEAPRRVTLACPAQDAKATLFTLGDSHAGAYTPLLGGIAADGQLSVEIYGAPGCPMFRLNRPYAIGNSSCAAYNRASMLDVHRRAKAGDLVFLPSLRMPRIADQWGELDATAQHEQSEATAARPQALEEAVTFLRPLIDRGVRVIIELPKPVFPSPPFRCMDWFNRSNPVCLGGFSINRTDYQDKSAPARDSIRALQTALPGLIVWDPLPSLCATDTCHAFAESGKPMFFDGDHLSRYGNAILLPAFRALLANLRDKAP